MVNTYLFEIFKRKDSEQKEEKKKWNKETRKRRRNTYRGTALIQNKTYIYLISCSNLFWYESFDWKFSYKIKYTKRTIEKKTEYYIKYGKERFSSLKIEKKRKTKNR